MELLVFQSPSVHILVIVQVQKKAIAEAAKQATLVIKLRRPEHTRAKIKWSAYKKWLPTIKNATVHTYILLKLEAPSAPEHSASTHEARKRADQQATMPIYPKAQPCRVIATQRQN